MPVPSPSNQSIRQAFIRELEAFKARGYAFANGSDKKLFPGTQREAFDAYLNGIKNQQVEGYFEMPTGVGKTALFLGIIGCYLRATENMPNAPRVLIHEPTDDLVAQTTLAFADFMPQLAPEIETDDEQGRQLDWSKSEVGLKRKGAKGNHKIVITTYQGQAADERKAAGVEKTYRPETVGLVIHDEAHYTTGKKFGPAAVDKFRGAIQLGVTATPEYSKDKTVAIKLANRYYNLPLNTAIERGDLCHVRPILIKTVLTDQEKRRLLTQARAFLADQGGRPLSEGQLEQLYNQVARNKAILNAYLTGSHPDTEERFLGQTGMIFGGGITHCNDFVRYANETLNKPAYRDVKNWLRNEGLCLIAPIHSAVPKEGVEIILGGKKEICTPDRIKELHRQGKILLLISDKQLMLGTDFPMDSFIADAVDRFSVPDATQRMGRGFRVDRGDERRGLEPNPEKSCAAINVIDEVTHEIYKGTPFHPIHAFEILHGAEHRPPGRRKGALLRFKEQPPTVHETMENLGFTFISRTEALRAVARTFKDNEKKKLPDKDDNWLSSGDTVDPSIVLGGKRRPIVETVKNLTGKSSPYDSGKLGIQTVAYKGQSIDLQKMRAGPTQPICIRRTHWDRVEKAAGVKPAVTLSKKDEHWLSSNDTHDSTIVPGGNRKPIQDVVKDLTGKLSPYDSQRLGIQTVTYKGQSIDLQKLQTSNKQAICIRRDHWNKVEKAAGVGPAVTLPTKDEHWLSSHDTQDSTIVPGGGRGPIVETVKNLTGKSSPYDSGKLGIQTVTYKGQVIDLQKMQSGVLQPICIRREHWDRVEKAAGVGPGITLPDKDEHWLSSTNTQEPTIVPGGQRIPMREAVKDLTGKLSPYNSQTLGIQTVTYKGQSIDLQKMQSGNVQPICIRRTHWSRVEKAAGVEQLYADDSVKAKLTVPKSIKPDSDDLKRTGRLRQPDQE